MGAHSLHGSVAISLSTTPSVDYPYSRLALSESTSLRDSPQSSSGGGNARLAPHYETACSLVGTLYIMV